MSLTRLRLKLHFIHVGYGDAVIIQLPEGKSILIDAGGSEATPRLHAALDKLDIQSIDMLIITHFHDDHVGGLPSILKKFILKTSDNIGKIFIPFEPETRRNKPEIHGLMNQLRKYPLSVLRQGKHLLKSPSLTIETLHPDIRTGNQNEDSLVLKITHGKNAFLLMADAGLKTQKKLYAHYGHYLKCDLMKIPHHANDSAVFGPFLECANPKISILTIGKNDYQAPNANTLAAYQAQSEALYRTDQDGNISAISDGMRLHIECGWT